MKQAENVSIFASDGSSTKLAHKVLPKSPAISNSDLKSGSALSKPSTKPPIASKIENKRGYASKKKEVTPYSVPEADMNTDLGLDVDYTKHSSPINSKYIMTKNRAGSHVRKTGSALRGS